jgi:hypothetical protein
MVGMCFLDEGVLSQLLFRCGSTLTGEWIIQWRRLTQFGKAKQLKALKLVVLNLTAARIWCDCGQFCRLADLIIIWEITGQGAGSPDNVGKNTKNVWQDRDKLTGSWSFDIDSNSVKVRMFSQFFHECNMLIHVWFKCVCSKLQFKIKMCTVFFIKSTVWGCVVYYSFGY